MADTQESLDRWRNFFRTPDHDIFDIIKNAIMVAANDFPSQLRNKRGLFTEMLYASNDNNNSSISASEITGLNGETKESKDAIVDHPKEVVTEMINVDNQVNSTNEDADALCSVDEIGDELFEEVLRIKEIIDHREEQSNGMLCDSLRKLKEMNVSVGTLQATKIGKSVNALKKNGSKDVNDLARTLIEDWKNTLNAWIEASKATVEEVEPEPVKTSSKQPIVEVKEEEQGLQCPPVDEGVFLDTPINMELSQVFNGLDDYGNPPNSKRVSEKQDHDGKLNCEEIKSPPSHKIRIKIRTKSPMQEMTETTVIEKKHVPHQGKRLDYSVETSIEKKLESSKRRLHERYEELEKAKRQKTIQLMEFKDLPKQKQSTNGLHQKPGHRKSLMNQIARTAMRK